MNKQSLINDGYKYICTQNSKSKIELWARFNGYKDTIVYLYYIPETDMVLEQTRQTIPYTQLDMMAQMRDKMREDFLKLDVEYDKENIWQWKIAFKRGADNMITFEDFIYKGKVKIISTPKRELSIESEYPNLVGL